MGVMTAPLRTTLAAGVTAVIITALNVKLIWDAVAG